MNSTSNTSKYYTADKILSLKDLEGFEPSIYLITTNRSAGKTTHFLIRSLKLFRKEKKKFCLIYRHKYELSSANLIFTDVLKMYPELGTEILEKPCAEGLFYELLIDGESCGYTVALSNVDSLKKYSPVFADVYYLIMDEFQKEDGKYLKNEPTKLQSLIMSVARGGGQQSREIKCFLLGNKISMLNPYFVFFDVTRRYKENTKYIRGHGWVAEFLLNESARKAVMQNSISRAFANGDYINKLSMNEAFYDTSEFIEKCTEKNRYIFTIKHNNKYWGIREGLKSGKTYITENFDKSCKAILVFESGQHSTNTRMLTRNSWIMKNLKEAYQLGLLRFQNLNAKNVIYDILAIDISL